MAWLLRALALLLSCAVVSDGFRVRQHRRSSSGAARTEAIAEKPQRGYVNKLYTWGAPALLDGGFLPDPRRGDGCWQGLRVINIKTDTTTGIWDLDVVTFIAQGVGYWHTNQSSVKMDENGQKWVFPCNSTERQGFQIPATSIHLQAVYKERADTLKDLEGGEATFMTRYFIVPSYEPAEKAAASISATGYKLVGSSIWDEKETHLMQHPSSKECILSFQGTTKERVLDWWDNLRFYAGAYCGIGGRAVHAGFRGQLRAILETPSFKENIQDKLPKCSDVTVIGHSLGGALAALYSYCVNAAPAKGTDGWEDYQLMQYFKAKPEVLDPLYPKLA